MVDRFGDAAWINGGSPTDGFLSFGLHTRGVFEDFYGSLAGHAWVDWASMGLRDRPRRHRHGERLPIIRRRPILR